MANIFKMACQHIAVFHIFGCLGIVCLAGQLVRQAGWLDLCNRELEEEFKLGTHVPTMV